LRTVGPSDHRGDPPPGARRKLATLTPQRIRELFERTFSFLAMGEVRPIGPTARKAAFEQVMNYFRQNQAEMSRIVETEVDVSVEKDDYILRGKVDLLLGGDGRLELLDFKTSPRPVDSPELLDTYHWQLCTYAHILERRHARHVDRLLLYWTSEPRKQDALMEFPYRPDMVEQAGRHFDDVVRRIQAGDFRVTKPPAPGICQECDLRPLCTAQQSAPAEMIL
ncbi:MAG: PD-(D/E)XK nuclease family protein, partial [Chloroflexi bacterium]|nr:PD-(D/E)XK nuclease family protein [Chloroflexota bacterium]